MALVRVVVMVWVVALVRVVALVSDFGLSLGLGLFGRLLGLLRYSHLQTGLGSSTV